MKIGDLVKFEPELGNIIDDQRSYGTILRFDIYNPGELTYPVSCIESYSERLVEVLWSMGYKGWILQSRVEVIS